MNHEPTTIIPIKPARMTVVRPAKMIDVIRAETTLTPRSGTG